MGTIIYAAADTPEAEEALRAAVELSHAARLRLVLVRVEHRPHGRPDRAVQRGRQLLDRLIATQRLGESVDTRVELGDCASTLARVAAEEAASVIVLGSHHGHWRRRHGFSELPDVLSATAPCPVTVVPPPARK